MVSSSPSQQKQNKIVKSKPPTGKNRTKPEIAAAGKFLKPEVSGSVYCAIVFCVALLFRWAVSVGPYSGFSKPPMFGDFEAQRHWMEITYNLPIDQWYHNTTDNDLMYWGLDYPPLTAYHSWLMGFVSSKLNASWVKLGESRGLENYHHKLFMRYSVLIADCLTLLPATVFFINVIDKQKDAKLKCYKLLTWFLYPGILLIDYGHFQYNCVSLGFCLFSIGLYLKNCDLLGSVFFLLALNYKQMELYHALPVFAYLFGTCVNLPLAKGIFKFLNLSFTVIFTFLIVWFPFLRTFDGFLQVLHRIFPIARGIYEDKVANFWCCLSVLVKWKAYFTNEKMALISALVTLILLAPSFIMLLIRPNKKQFKYALIVSSLIFFLFSFQVHEKSILLVAVPVLMVFEENVAACSWFLLISVLSLFPLAVKDEMQLAYFGLIFSYYVWLVDINRSSRDQKFDHFWICKFLVLPNSLLFHVSFLVGLCINLVSLIVPLPKNLPDLFSLLISSYCCLHFCLFLFYFYGKQYQTYVDGYQQDLHKKKK